MCMSTRNNTPVPVPSAAAADATNIRPNIANPMELHDLSWRDSRLASAAFSFFKRAHSASAAAALASAATALASAASSSLLPSPPSMASTCEGSHAHSQIALCRVVAKARHTSIASTASTAVAPARRPLFGALAALTARPDRLVRMWIYVTSLNLCSNKFCARAAQLETGEGLCADPGSHLPGLHPSRAHTWRVLVPQGCLCRYRHALHNSPPALILLIACNRAHYMGTP